MKLRCKYKETCSGCQYLDLTLQEQHELKVESLEELLGEAQIPLKSQIELLSSGAGHLRDRVDLVYDRGALGLYEKTSRQIVDIDECRQLSPALQAWLTELRGCVWPIQKGSLRLRVGPSGRKGLWLDFANLDIKNLLEEKDLLQKLQAMAFVEIGQRRKVPVLRDGVYKLKDPEPQVWFQTWIEDHPVELFSFVGSFTQPSLQANRLIANVIDRWFRAMNVETILEFGSGIGNLSFPALGRTRHLTACEIDEGALMSFEASLAKLSQTAEFAGIRDRARLMAGDFQNKNPQDFEKYDAVLVNPPRSGLKSFLDPLISAKHKPEFFVYMSCFPESFVEDGKKLRDAGYGIQDIKIVDQFPQTTHYEVLSLWTLKSS